MKRRKLHVIWLWGLLFLMTACGDDDYYYPSVKLEFVTVKAGMMVVYKRLFLIRERLCLWRKTVRGLLLPQILPDV